MALFVMTTIEGEIGGVQVVRDGDGLCIGYRFVFDTGEVPTVVPVGDEGSNLAARFLAPGWNMAAAFLRR